MVILKNLNITPFKSVFRESLAVQMHIEHTKFTGDESPAVSQSAEHCVLYQSLWNRAAQSTSLSILFPQQDLCQVHCLDSACHKKNYSIQIGFVWKGMVCSNAALPGRLSYASFYMCHVACKFKDGVQCNNVLKLHSESS